MISFRDRLEREAGRDPDKEDSDEEVMIANPFQPIGKHLVFVLLITTLRFFILHAASF